MKGPPNIERYSPEIKLDKLTDNSISLFEKID